MLRTRTKNVKHGEHIIFSSKQYPEEVKNLIERRNTNKRLALYMQEKEKATTRERALEKLVQAKEKEWQKQSNITNVIAESGFLILENGLKHRFVFRVHSNQLYFQKYSDPYVQLEKEKLEELVKKYTSFGKVIF